MPGHLWSASGAQDGAPSTRASAGPALNVAAADAVEVLPTTPGTVLLLLAALLPDDDELAA